MKKILKMLKILFVDELNLYSFFKRVMFTQFIELDQSIHLLFFNLPVWMSSTKIQSGPSIRNQAKTQSRDSPSPPPPEITGASPLVTYHRQPCA